MAEERTSQADEEQIAVLESLIERAASRGLRAGIAPEELQDLGQDEAAELIEQLRRRLGETAD